MPAWSRNEYSKCAASVMRFSFALRFTFMEELFPYHEVQQLLGQPTWMSVSVHRVETRTFYRLKTNSTLFCTPCFPKQHQVTGLPFTNFLPFSFPCEKSTWTSKLACWIWPEVHRVQHSSCVLRNISDKPGHRGNSYSCFFPTLFCTSNWANISIRDAWAQYEVKEPMFPSSEETCSCYPGPKRYSDNCLRLFRKIGMHTSIFDNIIF